MKKIILAVTLALSTLPVITQAAPSTEITRSHQCELVRIGSISASGGTIDDLTRKLAAQAKNRGADYFRITSLNTNTNGYATATLYNDAKPQA
ncbi:DUF1471 domain-containing protein [Escherichia coli]|nr:DUF1471 domain-containing protein [Escherichia coli]ELN9581882.1 DUF1471 domain-containing protein [Enterobacter roggenkampii]